MNNALVKEVEQPRSSNRRLFKHVETRVETEYDYDGNPYEFETEVTIFLVEEDGRIVWQGTEGEAHFSSDATSDWLPGLWQTEETRAQTVADALATFVSPYAPILRSQPPQRHREITHIYEIGSGVPVHGVPRLSEVRFQIAENDDPEGHLEWVNFVTYLGLYLAQGCYLSGNEVVAERYWVLR